MVLSTAADGALAGRLHRLLADHEHAGSVSARAPRRRWHTFVRTYPQLDQMRVLDLGGTVEFWRKAPVRPASVTVLNRFAQESDAEWVTTTVGDACEPPSALPHARYDLVYSNSVIEHVGGHRRRAAFAAAVHRLADHHWIQTPYLYFPLEPHWVFPGFQFLPLRLRASAIRRWPLIRTRPTHLTDALRRSMSVELLSRTHLAYYFPDSQIAEERVAGLIKSLIALR